MSLPNHFELLATDGEARAGRLTTPHGVVRTPAFMPVGTAGAMKGMHWREVRDAGTDIVLGNTYHLMLLLPVSCWSGSCKAAMCPNCATPARAGWSRSAFTATRSADLRSASRNR